MPIYTCNLCDLKTSNKMNYSKHIKTKKHLLKVKHVTNYTQTIPKLYPNNTIKKSIIYKCIHCDNIFSSASSL